MEEEIRDIEEITTPNSFLTTEEQSTLDDIIENLDNILENDTASVDTAQSEDNSSTQLLEADDFLDEMNTITENSAENNNAEINGLEDIVKDVIKEDIPENSKTLLIKESTVRFSSASWFNEIKNKGILIAGLGGIGSWTTLLISRLQPRYLRLYDADDVDFSNVGGQLYKTLSVGNRKVEEIDKIIKEFSSVYSVYKISDRYTRTSITDNIMICGFDNMESRRTFFDNWKTRVDSDACPKRNLLYIDARLLAEEFQVFCIRGDDDFNIKRYAYEYLFSDTEAEEPICSYKQTSFCAAMVGSVITNLVVNFVANKDEDIRDLPFLTTYNAALMYFKTEN